MTDEVDTKRIVVVGAGLAGVRTAEELRRGGFDGELMVIGDEPHLPYDRPPLSKDFVRGENDDTTLRPRDFFDEQRIDLRLGVRAQTLDTANREVTLSDGTAVSFDELIVATGLRPRRLSDAAGLTGVHVLRSVDDSRALRAEIVPGGRALIIGAGFIGCEVAASLRARGMNVVLVEPQPTPLASVLGEQVGALVARLHTGEGVDVRVGVGVRELRGADSVTGAVLSDGTELDVNLVVVGIGSVPVTDWLDGSGVRVENGVLCDGAGRTSAPHIWAVGDVAAWETAGGRCARLEHWTNAGEQAKVLAGALLGSGTEIIDPVPYFWSDQYGVKIQALGAVRAEDTVHVVRDDGRKFLAYYERAGRLTGVVGAGLPGQVMKARMKIAAGAPITEILAPTA
ncbi:FAD-dependent oxidoreductase [Rhodococcus sp. ACS1]|uniref:NAD(P)/FAD-dependent oxidoreductase n=1 Tax=Rhodococcus sp. ACS1 TaxID=2028570 RepID=UPI000BB0E237|nr:FAD-dependent oxidoreductase [Rhodococcus sp. ACS1]PBC39484.1 FAD-dependent oxidoreductase [Rhodococcus sp. ACS1]